MQDLRIQKEYGISPTQKDAFTIRMNVFVEEQQIPYELELDDLDAVTTHYVRYQKNIPIVTARILTKPEQWYIQRVTTLETARNQGYAKQLMDHILLDARKAGITTLRLNAQITALPFYAKSGFIEMGEFFLDADIPHKTMILKL